MLDWLIRIVGLLPLSVRRLIGRGVGSCISLLPTRDRRIAELQLRLYLGTFSATLLRQVYANVGRTVAEALDLDPIMRNTDEFWPYNEETRELLEEMARHRQPVLLLAAHFGNWDLLGAVMTGAGIRLVTAGREAHSKSLQPVLIRLRARYGIRTIWRSDASGLRDLVEAFRSNDVVAGLLDQDTLVSSVSVPFFGTPARTPSGLVAMAKRYNALIIFAAVFREGGRFRALFRRLDVSKSPVEILAEYNHQLEILIRQFPEQWVWFHKRWRSLPDGRRLSSREYISHLEKLRREARV